jgi:hypothetical protein
MTRVLPLVLSFSFALPRFAGLRTGPPIAEGLARPVVADLNGDGRIDLLARDQYTGSALRAFLGDGHGSFPRLASTKIVRLHDPLYPPGTYITHDIDMPCGRQFVKITAKAR